MALKGQLGSIGISDIANLLHVNRKTGMLKLRSSAFSAMLFFNEGEVVNAESKENTGEIAAYEIFQQGEGDFEFISTPPHKKVLIRQTLHDLILESARQKDTIKRLRQAVPKNYMIFQATIDHRMETVEDSMDEDTLRLITLMDGTRDVDDLVEASGYSEFKVLTLMTELIDKHLVEPLNIIHLLTYDTLSGFLKSDDIAYVDKSLFEEWKNELITEEKMRFVQIRTQQGRIGVLRLGSRKELGKRIVFTEKSAKKLRIKIGDQLICKPISETPNAGDDGMLDDFFE